MKQTKTAAGNIKKLKVIMLDGFSSGKSVWGRSSKHQHQQTLALPVRFALGRSVRPGLVDYVSFIVLYFSFWVFFFKFFFSYLAFGRSGERKTEQKKNKVSVKKN